ncbi:haloacid dehalogenase-like hydrolase [Phytomonospora sp. NPDC050363]|uniref:HAD family hydrolase n=1 Tax=Phytomonospora sp. NPDC050363 TaxID=3155642 RepID=UPI0034054CED
MPERNAHDLVVILWDVDRTLVDTAGFGREVFADAFLALHGRPMGAFVDTAGRTDLAILAETLTLNDVAHTGPYLAYFEAITAAAQARAALVAETGRALPGAAETIAALAAPDVVQTVVTGNLRAIAHLKLAAFGLHERLDFEVGGYGDDHHDRAELVRLAHRRIQAEYRTTVAPHRLIVIGDTVHDVKGALDTGALAVGVATGGTTADDLRRAGAHIVVDDLTDPAGLRAAIREKVDGPRTA